MDTLMQEEMPKLRGLGGENEKDRLSLDDLAKEVAKEQDVSLRFVQSDEIERARRVLSSAYVAA